MAGHGVPGTHERPQPRTASAARWQSPGPTGLTARSPEAATAAGESGHSSPQSRARISAPVLRWPAPAHHDRHGPGLQPDLLVADEPTTALDVTVQQLILDLIKELVAERYMAWSDYARLGVIAELEECWYVWRES